MRIIAILIFTFLSTQLFAQKKFIAGLTAGVNTSQVHGDMYSGFDKAGLVFGGLIQREINEKFNASFEIIYTQKGSRKNQNFEKGDYNFYHLKLYYIEVPVLLKYKYKKFVPELGLSFGRLIKEYEENTMGNITGYSPFNKMEFCLITGLGYSLTENILFNVRYTNSIIPVRKFDHGLRYNYGQWFYNIFNRGMYNNVLSFSFIYLFKNES